MVAALVASYFVASALLEVPTGGLSDVWGRKKTLTIAGLVAVAAMAAMGLSTSMIGLAVGLLLSAVSASLMSGPLEAWFIDACAEHGEPEQTKSLGLANSGSNVAFAVGAGVIALANWVFADLPSAGTARVIETTPMFLFAGGLNLMGVVLVWRLVQEPPRLAESSRESLVTGTVKTIRRTGVAISKSPALQNLVLVAAAAGVTVGAFDVLVPLALQAEQSSGSGTSTFAMVFIVAFVGAAISSSLSDRIEESMGGSRPALAAIIGLDAIASTACLAMPGSTGLAAGFVVMWIAGGPLHPLLFAELHRNIGSSERATAVSALTLAATLGGAAGVLVTGAVGSTLTARHVLIAAFALYGLTALKVLRQPEPAVSMVRLDHAEGA
jgi:MFS family permease